MKYIRLIDPKACSAEEEAIDALEDSEEAEIRRKLLEELQEKEWDYNARIREYAYRQHCRAVEARGLRFRTISKRTAARKWDSFFAADLTAEDKRSIHYGDFKWHMFSYERIGAIKGSDARRAFNRCRKGAAYLFIQCTDEAWYIENAQLLSAADLDTDFDFARADVYIFDTEGKWAYARTHERSCGPYFLRMKQKTEYADN